jgi:hypothetical protein
MQSLGQAGTTWEKAAHRKDIADLAHLAAEEVLEVASPTDSE